MTDDPIGRTTADTAGEPGEPHRRGDRDSLLILATLTPEAGGTSETVRVRNVSTGGLMAQASEVYRPGMGVMVTLDAVGAVRGTVAWAEAGRIGIAFDHPIDKARARKPQARPGPDIFRPGNVDHRRPAIAPR